MAHQQKVVIAGASGLVGHAAVEHFASLQGWDVVGVSRRVPDDLPGAEVVSVDLMDAAACERVFGEMGDVTHLVYAALQEAPGLRPGWFDPELIERNASMLRNLFEPLERVAPLEHISLLHGTKAYGGHYFGPEGARIPLRERDPRRDHPNFYFVQEDYLHEKQRGASWRMTTFRPTVIYGDAGGNNMNPLPAIGAYAALLREEGRPLDFPGQGETPSLREAVDADLVARALSWAATAPNVDGEAYNLTNGDVFMWENIWPAIAETFGMEPGEHRPMSLAEELPKRDREWASLVEKYDLRVPKTIVEFVGWNSLVYADGILGGTRRGTLPTLNSTVKARQAGFHDCMDTEDMFRKWFERMQRTRLLPPAEARPAAQV